MISQSRIELVEQYKLLQELSKRQSRKQLKKFVQYTKTNYEMKWFH